MLFYPCLNYLFYMVRPLCLAFLSFKVFFFVYVLLISYIGKYLIYIDFCGGIACPMFAVLNNQNTFKHEKFTYYQNSYFKFKY